MRVPPCRAGPRRIRRDAPRQRNIAACPSGGGIQRGQLERIEPLAQDALERVLPAGLDIDLLPQPAGMIEPVRAQPRGSILATADLRLQRRKRLCARFALGEAAARNLPFVAGRAMALLQRLHDFVQCREALLAAGQVGAFLLELVGDERDLVVDRCGELARLGIEPLATLRERTQKFRGTLAPRGGHLDRLLDLDFVPLDLGQRARRLGDGGLERRQRRRGGAFLFSRGLAPRQRGFDLALARAGVGCDRGELCGEGGDLLGDLRDLLRETAFAFARELQLLLEPGDLGIRGVEGSLPLVQCVAGLEVLGAQRLKPVFGGAQIGLERFEARGQIGDLGRMPLAQAHRVLLLGVPEHVLRLPEARFEVAVFGRDLRLRVEPRDLRAELAADVLDTRQVLAGVGQPAFGFLAPLLVLRYAGGFLQENAELFGLGLDHARDHPLLDDRVRARTEAGAEEQVVYVAAADRDVIDVVGRVAFARQDALDRQLAVLAPLAADSPLAVVEEQLDRCAADRLALARAVEYHVLHRFAAQGGSLGLAEHPAHRIDHVGLAAAVRSDDADELAGCRDSGWIDERLEAGELDLCEAQFEFFWTCAARPGQGAPPG